MHLGMAVQARPQQHHARRGEPTRQRGAAEGLAIVLRFVVTILTKIGRTLLQQARLHRTVRRVADGALFLHRRVLPQKWSPLFVMAGVAGVVNGDAFQEVGADGPMGVMAIGAGHQAFNHGMMRRPEIRCPLLGVAGEAHGRLCCLGENRVLDGM